MKPKTAFNIDTPRRPSTADEKAIEAVLKTKKIAGAAMVSDLYDEEPLALGDTVAGRSSTS